ncbi:hypothetical protein ACUXS1_001502 [Staphylococcus warneri]
MNNSVQNTDDFLQNKLKKELCFLKSKSINPEGMLFIPISIVIISTKMMYGTFLILRFLINFKMI